MRFLLRALQFLAVDIHCCSFPPSADEHQLETVRHDDNVYYNDGDVKEDGEEASASRVVFGDADEVTIVSRWFSPPSGWDFAPFPPPYQEHYADVMVSGISGGDEYDAGRVYVWGQYDSQNAEVFPLYAEGNLSGGSGGGSNPHWATKVTPVYAVDVKIVKPEAQQPWHYTDDIMADYEIVRRTESLKFIIFLNRAISSLSQFGEDIVVSTLDQRQRAVIRQTIAVNGDDQLAYNGQSIRVTVTNQELAALHYLEEVPPVLGGYHVSVETPVSTNFNDGDAFEAHVRGTTGLVMGRGSHQCGGVRLMHGMQRCNWSEVAQHPDSP